MALGRRPRGAALLAVLAGAFTALTGCAPESGIHDGYALSQAKRVAVLPAVGAPGPDGKGAGAMQAGVLITALANLKRYEVQGPARLRKALADESAGDAWDRALQARLTKELGIDLLVVSETIDYRFTKEWKSSWFFVGSSEWTESTYHAAMNVRFISPDDGRLVYSGSGLATSREGYGPAVLAATNAALDELKRFLAEKRP